ncbi:hypothetical protein KAW38_02630 [Candidatus Micrarchaeota archaeon]|nr:hypothetical protein [Candidatus Micrarchaeota archaeon]
MKKYLILFLLLSAPLFAVTLEQCETEYISCIKQCCPLVDGEWDESIPDCAYDANKYSDADLQEICGHCFDSHDACLEQAQSGECCLPISILGFIGLGLFVLKG